MSSFRDELEIEEITQVGAVFFLQELGHRVLTEWGEPTFSHRQKKVIREFSELGDPN
jgi:hypothetical protein